jgi:hypothetical protein
MTKGNKVSTKLNKLDQGKELDTVMAVLSTRTYTDAAERLGIDRTTLYLRMDKWNIKERIAKIPEKALARLELMSIDAAETLTGKLDNPRESMEAATEILDRVGISGKQAQQNMQVNVQGNISDIEFVTDDTESQTTQESI